MPDLWFQPTRLHFQKVHVRGPTNWFFLELADADGTFGAAEITCTHLGDQVVPAVARLADLLRGERLGRDDDVLHQCGLTVAELETNHLLATAVSALRCAVADALAKRAHMSLAEFIRRWHGHGRPPARSVPLYANINRSMLPNDAGPVDRSPGSFATMAERAAHEGFATAKCAPFDECRPPFEGTGLPEAAIAGLQRVAAAKEAIGPQRALYVDCHARFDLNTAFAVGQALKAAGAAWFEEPVDPIRNTQDMRRIHASSPLPNAGAEQGYGRELFKRLIEQDVLDIVMPDVVYCGGPVEAYTAGIELESMHPGSVSLHCPSGPLSLLASAHATAAFGPMLPLEHAVYEVDWRHEVLVPPEQIEDGHLHLPEGHGLGARVNPVLVEAHGEQWEA